MKDRKCFQCNKAGHVARDCPEKKAPLKAIEDAGARQRPAVMMVQLAPPRPKPQGGNLGDHIRKAVPPARVNQNRFQPLTQDKVVFWEDVARASAPPTARQPSLAEADFPPMLKSHVHISLSAHFSQEGMSKGICKGKDALVGIGGPSVKEQICIPVVTPIKSKF